MTTFKNGLKEVEKDLNEFDSAKDFFNWVFYDSGLCEGCLIEKDDMILKISYPFSLGEWNAGSVSSNSDRWNSDLNIESFHDFKSLGIIAIHIALETKPIITAKSLQSRAERRERSSVESIPEEGLADRELKRVGEVREMRTSAAAAAGAFDSSSLSSTTVLRSDDDEVVMGLSSKGGGKTA